MTSVNGVLFNYKNIETLGDDIYWDDLKYNHDDYSNEVINDCYKESHMVDYIKSIIFQHDDLYFECGKHINIHDNLELQEFYNSGILNEIFKDLGHGEIEYILNIDDYKINEKDNKRAENLMLYNEYVNLWQCNNCGSVNYVIDKNNVCKICDEPYRERARTENTHGEPLIRKLLEKHELKFIEQYPLGTLRYDFLVIYNRIKYFIEVNGLQHYESIEFFGGVKAFIEGNERYEIKKQHAIENGVFIELDYRESNLDLLEKRFYNEFYYKYIKRGR